VTGKVAAFLAVVVLAVVMAAALAPISNRTDRYSDGDVLYAALREQPHTSLSIGEGEIEVVFADGAPGLDPHRRRSARRARRHPTHGIGPVVRCVSEIGYGSPKAFFCVCCV